MKIPDKVYDVLKWVIMIAAPALVTLISTLGSIYSVDMTVVTATIGAITTFVGALIGISTSTYNKEKNNG